jgi:hypothetical protein
MGLVVLGAKVPHINYPFLAICLFLVQNQKMVIGFINQLPVAFEEGC